MELQICERDKKLDKNQACLWTHNLHGTVVFFFIFLKRKAHKNFFLKTQDNS